MVCSALFHVLCLVAPGASGGKEKEMFGMERCCSLEKMDSTPYTWDIACSKKLLVLKQGKAPVTSSPLYPKSDSISSHS